MTREKSREATEVLVCQEPFVKLGKPTIIVSARSKSLKNSKDLDARMGLSAFLVCQFGDTAYP